MLSTYLTYSSYRIQILSLLRVCSNQLQRVCVEAKALAAAAAALEREGRVTIAGNTARWI